MAGTIRERFRDLHASGTFVMPNPWDPGSARVLAQLGFPALATTSSGFAAALGRLDQRTTRDEVVGHVAALARAVDVPLNVDAERCYAETLDEIAVTVDLLAQAGAAGISIEDYDPVGERIEPTDVAAQRVDAAARACRRHGIVLTARAENHLYAVTDLDNTIARLKAYRDAGADVVYAPGLRRIQDIARLVEAVPAPVNVLALPDGPSVSELADVGVRRVSTGGALALTAYGALRAAARELLDQGTSTYRAGALTPDEVQAIFG